MLASCFSEERRFELSLTFGVPLECSVGISANYKGVSASLSKYSSLTGSKERLSAYIRLAALGALFSILVLSS